MRVGECLTRGGEELTVTTEAVTLGGRIGLHTVGLYCFLFRLGVGPRRSMLAVSLTPEAASSPPPALICARFLSATCPSYLRARPSRPWPLHSISARTPGSAGNPLAISWVIVLPRPRSPLHPFTWSTPGLLYDLPARPCVRLV